MPKPPTGRTVAAAVLAILGAAGLLLLPLGTAGADTPALKTTIGGLEDRQGMPVQPVVTSFVANVNWSDIQLTPGGPIQPNNAIDQAIAAARASSFAGTAQIKIRLFAGANAPDWAKNLGGPPVTLTDSTDGTTTFTVGRFWTTAYQAAYADLQVKLAALYDSVPEIHDVAISGCMTLYAEPMIRQNSTVQNRTALLAAGYTRTGDLACQTAEIQAHTVWTRTRSSLAANPYQSITAAGAATTSVPDALSILDQCRAILGSRCVIANNSIRTDYLSGTGNYQDLYAGMLQRGGPLTFQTATAARVGDLPTVLSWAAAHGVAAMELPFGYPTLLTADQENSFNATLAATAATP